MQAYELVLSIKCNGLLRSIFVLVVIVLLSFVNSANAALLGNELDGRTFDSTASVLWIASYNSMMRTTNVEYLQPSVEVLVKNRRL